MLNHTGGMESDEYKRYPCKWTDDTRSDWNVEKPTKEFNSWVPKIALKENISMFTDPKNRNSEISFLTNDMGGFDMGKTNQLDEELFIRWMQFSFFTPIVEVFSQPENISGNMAYKISARADSLFRKYSHLRMELFPYIYSYAHKVRLESRQMMQAMPENHFDYLFGNEMLIAPVYEQFAVNRMVNLPTGNWFNYWTNETIEGGKKVEVKAPIEQIPLFIRQGSIIPMRRYASSIEKGTNDTLIIHVYPGSNSVFDLIEDDGLSNDYLQGVCAKTKMTLQNSKTKAVFQILPIEGSFNGMSKDRIMKFIIHQHKNLKSLVVNGKKLKFSNSDKIIETEYFGNSKLKKTTLSINSK